MSITACEGPSHSRISADDGSVFTAERASATPVPSATQSVVSQPERVVSLYIELAQGGQFDDLKKHIHVEKDEPPKARSSGKDGDRGVSPSSDIFIKIDRENLKQVLPKFLLDAKLYVDKIETREISNDRATILVRFRSTIDPDKPIDKVFRLKKFNGEWKITYATSRMIDELPRPKSQATHPL